MFIYIEILVFMKFYSMCICHRLTLSSSSLLVTVVISIVIVIVVVVISINTAMIATIINIPTITSAGVFAQSQDPKTRKASHPISRA